VENRHGHEIDHKKEEQQSTAEVWREIKIHWVKKGKRRIHRLWGKGGRKKCIPLGGGDGDGGKNVQGEKKKKRNSPQKLNGLRRGKLLNAEKWVKTVKKGITEKNTPAQGRRGVQTVEPTKKG